MPQVKRVLMVLALAGLTLPLAITWGQSVDESTTQPTTGPTTKPSALRSDHPWLKHAPKGAEVTARGWFAPRPVWEGKPDRPTNPKLTYVIPVREPITTKTYEAMRRKAARCRGKGADLVILDMDTWGGAVGAAMDITRMLKTDLADIYVVCYVRTRAVSAGSMIALASDEIIMNPVGKLGDSAPIIPGGKLEGVEREKIETVIREEFTESAKRNGYPIALAETLVSAKREAWLIRNETTGELRYVLKKDWQRKVVNPPSGGDDAPSLGETRGWKYLDTIVPEGELLTMKPDRAMELGFVTKVVEADADEPHKNILAEFGATEAIVLSDSYVEQLVAFLTSMPVQTILGILALMAIYSETQAPGLGVPAVVAIVAVGLLVGSHYIIGLANVWEIALLIIGIGLILVEIFIIPGFGVAGIGGILCCVISVFAMILPNAPGELPVPTTALDWSYLRTGMVSLLISISLGIVGIMLLMRYLPHTPLLNRLVLAQTGPTEPDTSFTEDSPIRRIQPGDEGTVVGTCRPVGRVLFGDDLLDAVTEGGMIESGATVRAIRRSGNCIVIEEVSENG